MEQNKNSLNTLPYKIMSIVVGIVFLVSAYAKLYPVTGLIDNIFSRFDISYSWASFLAKGIIGLEIALGLLFIIMIYGYKKWVLHVSTYLLIAFTFFIIYIWYAEGAEADCGCMGNVVKMSPLLSIIKNLVLLSFIAALYFWKYKTNKAKNYFALIATVILIFYPVVFYPNDIDTELITANKSDVNTIKLGEERQLLMFATTTCPHCREAGKILANIHKKDASLRLSIIFPNKGIEKSEYLLDYMIETGASSIPHYLMDTASFRSFAGRGVPSIIIIENKTIVNKIHNYTTLTVGKLHRMLK